MNLTIILIVLAIIIIAENITLSILNKHVDKIEKETDKIIKTLKKIDTHTKGIETRASTLCETYIKGTQLTKEQREYRKAIEALADKQRQIFMKEARITDDILKKSLEEEFNKVAPTI